MEKIIRPQMRFGLVAIGKDLGGLHANQVRRFFESGRLCGVKVGRTWFCEPAEIARFARELRHQRQTIAA